jgi:hypothetical protein
VKQLYTKLQSIYKVRQPLVGIQRTLTEKWLTLTEGFITVRTNKRKDDYRIEQAKWKDIESDKRTIVSSVSSITIAILLKQYT